MKSEDTPFEGGPMDGRTLPVLLGITGHPPKTYRIPVPDPAGGPPAVLIYRRVSLGQGRLTHRWKYVHDPGGERERDRPKWPWTKPARRPGPGATPGGNRDDADG
ncbi:hypothetical protein AB0K92_24230 [Streptomyces sp. NPDC052687]|uniref:hypothetical protein n=1 Tax=Streptomyces sp. NPDC052687 TaxID=3154759 RepID=UPI00344051F8